MKLEVLLRKAAPFLLIAILIACLFNMPQKEGMKGIDHYMKQGVDDGKDYYHSVDNVGKDYHTYESSPTHQWLKNAGSNNKYANDIHEYTIYKPADHWLNSKPGLKTSFNIYKTLQGFNVTNPLKPYSPEVEARVARIKKFEDLPEREEIDDFGDQGDIDALHKFEDLPEREEIGEVAKDSADTTGDTISKDAVSGAEEVKVDGENPVKTGEEFRAGNAEALETVTTSPISTAETAITHPTNDVEYLADHPYDDVEAMRSRITFY